MKTGLEPLVDVLHKITRLFPTGDSALLEETALEVQDHSALARTITYMSKLGISNMIDLGAGADDKDPVRFSSSSGLVTSGVVQCIRIDSY